MLRVLGVGNALNSKPLLVELRPFSFAGSLLLANDRRQSVEGLLSSLESHALHPGLDHSASLVEPLHLSLDALIHLLCGKPPPVGVDFGASRDRTDSPARSPSS